MNTLDSGHSCIPLEKLMSIDMLNINYSLVVAEIFDSYCDGNDRHGHVATVYHICLICTAIESPPQGGIPPQGALFSPAKWPWYGLHTAVVKKRLRPVCTKFAMLIAIVRAEHCRACPF